MNLRFAAAEIAAQLQGEVVGDAGAVLTGFAPASLAKAGDLTFAENEKYLAHAEQSAATAILVDGQPAASAKVLIRVANARAGFAKALALFFPEPVFPAVSHPTSLIAPSAKVDPTAHIGPYCVIGEGTVIGAQVVLEGGNFLGEHCQLGAGTHLFPQVTLYARTQIGQRVRIHAGTVVGADGFGYVLEQGRHLKVPQVGHVIIQDDVEIGANVTIDRGTLGPTVIGRGTKIDNLVQIAHNVVVGENCIIVAQVGIAGSTKLGNFVTLAGQVGLAGHLRIGDRVTVAAQSGVMNDIAEGQKWFGAPARPDRQMKRQLIAIEQLPELIRRVKELERRLEQSAAQTTPTQPQPAN